MARELIICSTPECEGEIWGNFSSGKVVREYVFCSQCRRMHSSHALVVQAKHGKSIVAIIEEAKMFASASRMADYIGVSFVTMYTWIKKYYGMTFQEFKRTYICKSDKCYLLNIKRSSYSRHDYILKKIRDKRYCACLNALEEDHIMTDAPIRVISSILAGKPRILKISDNTFAITPNPVRFTRKLFPVYELYDLDI